MKNPRYVIYAPSYNENSGGTVALHQLSVVLHKHQVKVCIFPMMKFHVRGKIFRVIEFVIRIIIGKFHKIGYRIFNSKLIPKCYFIDKKNDIVIYPEIVYGNPLGAKRVVRWLLNEPGYFTGNYKYGENDLFFYYQKAFISKMKFNNIGGELKIVHIQYAYKNKKYPERKGTCYILRKGKGREIVHDLNNSVLIDGLSHKEIAEIFNRTEMCISYDMYTMYSQYAAVCGCMSVVVPDPAVDKNQWYPKKELRWGMAYGFDDVEWAEATQKKVLPALINAEKNSNQASIVKFLEQCEMYFI